MENPPVQFVDLVTQHNEIRDEILKAVEQVFDHGQFVLGEEVTKFEENFANYCGSRYAVGLNSGLDALVLGLRALGVGEDSEVITPPNSYIASSGAIGLLGARPVFVDVGPDYNIDPHRIERAITDKTKAIMPVHLTGRPAEMTEIISISTDHGIPIIEDAAQAISATYRGQHVGTFGAIGCFSLHPLKTLNACGDGGVLVTDDDTILERILQLRNHGLKNRDVCAEWGYNSRLDTIQATILDLKMKRLDGWTTRRRANAHRYIDGLSGVGDLLLPCDKPYEYAAYHTFIVRSKFRNAIREHLQNKQISTGVHYPIPIHLQPAAAYLAYQPGDMPEAETQAGEILSLPVHHNVELDDIDVVIGAIKEFFKS